MRLLKKTVNTAGAAMLAASIGMSATASEDANTLKVGAVFVAGVEAAWQQAIVSAFERVQEERYQDVDFSFDFTENVFGAKGLEVIEAYSESGEYDVIWAHGSFSDQVEELKDEFPDILYVTTGSGNRPLGDNSYLLYTHIYEASYLAGVFAGHTTKSGVLGAVGLFPGDDVNDQINGFFDGARSVNPEIDAKVTFINSWYDPSKAAEATSAQAAAGADVIYQIAEAFQVCVDRSILCIGNYIDYAQIVPEAVPMSTKLLWDPQVKYVIDQWKAHKETGEPYNAPMEKVWFNMADGGSSLWDFNDALSDRISQESKDAVAAAQSAIISGDLVVDHDMSLPVSN